MKSKIVSMFTDHYNDLMSVNSLEELKQELFQIIKKANENTMMSRKITLSVINSSNLLNLQKYVTNSMLKYEGLGVSKF